MDGSTLGTTPDTYYTDSKLSMADINISLSNTSNLEQQDGSHVWAISNTDKSNCTEKKVGFMCTDNNPADKVEPTGRCPLAL